MKILHYSAIYAPAWKWGGPPRSVANLAEGLAALGHDVSVVTTDAGLEHDSALPRGKEIDRNGVKVTYHPATFRLTGLWSEAAVGELNRRAGEFDLIHISGVWQPTGASAAAAARRAKVPYLVSPRGMLGPYSFSQRRLKKWLFWFLVDRRSLQRARALHATSQKEAGELIKLVPEAKVVCVPNAVDLSAWRRDEVAAAKVRAECGVLEDESMLLASGRLHHKKGLDILPEALASVRSPRRWRIVFAGPDEDGTKARLEAAFAKVGLMDRVFFAGQCDTHRLRAFYSAADLLLFPSRHENFGNVAVEALACGCPVLLSDEVGAAGEVCDIDGVTVCPARPVEWTKAIGAALARPFDSSKLALRSNSASARFSPLAVADRMAAVYRGLLS